MGAGVNPGQSSGLLQTLGPESGPGWRERCKEWSKGGDDPAESSQKNTLIKALLPLLEQSQWHEATSHQWIPFPNPGRIKVSLLPKHSVPIGSHPDPVCAALGNGNGGQGLGVSTTPTESSTILSPGGTRGWSCSSPSASGGNSRIFGKIRFVAR